MAGFCLIEVAFITGLTVFILYIFILVVKLKNDEIQLKDALVKLQSLNEALGHDKMDLSKVIRHVELERDGLNNDLQEIEMDKASIKEVSS